MAKRAVAVAIAAGAAIFILTKGGSVIRKKYLTNGKSDFNFRSPRCPDKPKPPDDPVEVRYLGAGGAVVSWRGDTILLGPYFSHTGSLFAAVFGHLAFDEKRIAAGMANIDASKVRAILTGHSHFDHLGDVPFVVEHYTPKATVYTNDSGLKLLDPYRDMRKETVEKTSEGDWIRIKRPDGTDSAIRFTPVPSAHAPQLCHWNHWPCTYAPGEVPQALTKRWDEEPPKLSSLRGGRTFAFVIDLLDENGAARFRIYYNDSSAGAPKGIPTKVDARGYDLAIVCMASWDFVDRYPSTLLRTLQPRHVLVSHYDDFFAKQDGSYTFAPLLTDRKANAFMSELKKGMEEITAPRPPVPPICGPATDRWSMPVPGWPLYFRP